MKRFIKRPRASSIRPPVEGEHAVSALRKIEIVRDVNRRQLAGLMEAVKQVHMASAGALIRLRGALIQLPVVVARSTLWISVQGTGEDNALLFAAGKFSGAVLRSV